MKKKNDCSENTTNFYDKATIEASNALSNSTKPEMDLSKLEDTSATDNQSKNKIKYEENMMMTCVQGFWIRRSSIMDVDKIRNEKHDKILASRTNGDISPLLSKEEEKRYQVMGMKVIYFFCDHEIHSLFPSVLDLSLNISFRYSMECHLFTHF